MKLIYVQTVLTEEEEKALIKKANTTSRKEALKLAVEHYLFCDKIVIK